MSWLIVVDCSCVSVRGGIGSTCIFLCATPHSDWFAFHAHSPDTIYDFLSQIQSRFCERSHAQLATNVLSKKAGCAYANNHWQIMFCLLLLPIKTLRKLAFVVNIN